jgi:hypothetical protein
MILDSRGECGFEPCGGWRRIPRSFAMQGGCNESNFGTTSGTRSFQPRSVGDPGQVQKTGAHGAQHLKQLIEDDLALDQEARSKSLDELAAPFRKAFAGVDEEELDQLVARARRQSKRVRGKLYNCTV